MRSRWRAEHDRLVNGIDHEGTLEFGTSSLAELYLANKVRVAFDAMRVRVRSYVQLAYFVCVCVCVASEFGRPAS
jgi:hypothetical protein